jgi:hypothetical protein
VVELVLQPSEFCLGHCSCSWSTKQDFFHCAMTVLIQPNNSAMCSWFTVLRIIQHALNFGVLHHFELFTENEQMSL